MVGILTHHYYYLFILSFDLVLVVVFVAFCESSSSRSPSLILDRQVHGKVVAKVSISPFNNDNNNDDSSVGSTSNR